VYRVGLWNVFRVLLGRTFVSGLHTKKPLKKTGYRRSAYEHSWFTSSPVSSGMGNHLRAVARVCHLGRLCNEPTGSTQPCIPPGWLNRVAASTGVKAGMSPLPDDLHGV